jgi:hypothetical protein
MHAPMNLITWHFCFLLTGLLLIVSCRSEAPPAECPPLPEPEPPMEITPLRIPRDPADDFCNACVRSEMGYISCQREYERQRGEARESLKKRAIAKACMDAGYPKDSCPESAQIGVQCKGDPENPGGLSAGEALQIISGERRSGTDDHSPANEADAKPKTP